MTPNERELLIDSLTVLSEYYEKPKSEAQMGIYLHGLDDLPIADVLNAIERLVKSSLFFPKVSEIRDAVEGKTEEHAELAWFSLLKEIQRVGYTGAPQLTETTRLAMKSVWGNWTNLCQTLPAEGPELLGWAKQFKSAYRLMGDKALRRFITGNTPNLLGE